jgi:ribosomal protein L16 Arg81 hydroxylase
MPAADFDIVLSPGDVLFVPKHWWHFVTTESDVAVSVNAWQPVWDDDLDRAQEGIAKYCYGALLYALVDNDLLDKKNAVDWLCPSEMSLVNVDNQFETITDLPWNYAYLTEALEPYELDAVEVLKRVLDYAINPENLRQVGQRPLHLSLTPPCLLYFYSSLYITHSSFCLSFSDHRE